MQLTQTITVSIISFGYISATYQPSRRQRVQDIHMYDYENGVITERLRRFEPAAKFIFVHYAHVQRYNKESFVSGMHAKYIHTASSSYLAMPMRRFPCQASIVSYTC